MTESLFWYGCNMTRHGEIIRLSQRLLEAVGVGVAPVGGPGACCGSPKESTPRIAEGMANRTMESFNAWAGGVRSPEGRESAARKPGVRSPEGRESAARKPGVRSPEGRESAARKPGVIT